MIPIESRQRKISETFSLQLVVCQLTQKQQQLVFDNVNKVILVLGMQKIGCYFYKKHYYSSYFIIKMLFYKYFL